MSCPSIRPTLPIAFGGSAGGGGGAGAGGGGGAGSGGGAGEGLFKSCSSKLMMCSSRRRLAALTSLMRDSKPLNVAEILSSVFKIKSCCSKILWLIS